MEPAQPVRVRFSGDYVAELSVPTVRSCPWCAWNR
jgi:hypothetical protein